MGKDETVADSTSWRNPMEANKVKKKIQNEISIHECNSQFVHVSIELGGVSCDSIVQVWLDRR